MRVTNNMMISTVLRNMSNNAGRLNDLQFQMQTQSKINKLSDDPLGAILALRSRSSQNQITLYQKNLDSAHSWLQAGETALMDINSIMQSMYESALDASTDGKTSSDRQKIADKVREFRDQLVQTLNATYADKYMFGGYNNQVKPFEVKNGSLYYNTFRMDASDNTNLNFEQFQADAVNAMVDIADQIQVMGGTAADASSAMTIAKGAIDKMLEAAKVASKQPGATSASIQSAMQNIADHLKANVYNNATPPSPDPAVGNALDKVLGSVQNAITAGIEPDGLMQNLNAIGQAIDEAIEQASNVTGSAGNVSTTLKNAADGVKTKYDSLAFDTAFAYIADHAYDAASVVNSFIQGYTDPPGLATLQADVAGFAPNLAAMFAAGVTAAGATGADKDAVIAAMQAASAGFTGNGGILAGKIINGLISSDLTDMGQMTTVLQEAASNIATMATSIGAATTLGDAKVTTQESLQKLHAQSLWLMEGERKYEIEVGFGLSMNVVVNGVETVGLGEKNLYKVLDDLYNSLMIENVDTSKNAPTFSANVTDLFNTFIQGATAFPAVVTDAASMNTNMQTVLNAGKLAAEEDNATQASVIAAMSDAIDRGTWTPAEIQLADDIVAQLLDSGIENPEQMLAVLDASATAFDAMNTAVSAATSLADAQAISGNLQLENRAAALLADYGTTTGSRAEDITPHISRLQNGQKHILSLTAIYGARTNRCDILKERYSVDQENYTKRLSNIEDVDPAEIIMYLKMAESVYTASLSAGARVIQPSLMDFLR